MPAKYKKAEVCREIRDWVERHDSYWRPLHEAITEEEAFLDGDRFADDSGPYNKDRRLTQIRGQEITDTIRHIVAQATVRPRNVESRPSDRQTDPDAGEIAGALVERELSDPWKGFEDCYEDCLTSAREKRLGVVWMDWEPECGPFGEILYSFGDPRRFRWDEDYDPHHPMCERLIREKRVDVDWARDYFKAKHLQPDKMLKQGRSRADRPILVGGTYLDPSQVDDDKVTLWECWYKRDRTTKMGKAEPQPLKPEEQYMVCVGECGYRGEPAPNQPEMIPQACPTCGGDLERVDILDQTPEMLAYAKGRRLVIMAPFSPSPDDKPLSDGGWPIPTARSFPGLFITAYTKPGRPIGYSDTYYMWEQQVASDQLRTAALQQVLEHKDYWIMPRTGIVDFRNRRWEGRDDQFNMMFRDHSKAEFGSLDVERLNGTGVDPAFSTVFGIVQQALTQYRGVADLGLTPDNSKNIAASTVEQHTAQVEIPTEHFNRRKNRALGKFYGVVWDYIRATYTPERLARLNLEGTDILARIEGDDLPNYDFVISDTPPFTGIEKQKSEAAQALIQFSQQAPDFLDIYAEAAGLPPSIVRKIQKRQEELQAAAQEAEAMGGGMPMEEGMPPDMGAEEAEPGMVPELTTPGAM